MDYGLIIPPICLGSLGSLEGQCRDGNCAFVSGWGGERAALVKWRQCQSYLG
jgi:hypothetical protein